MRRLLPLLILLVLVPAGTAHAGPGEIGIADDRVLMSGGPLADRAVAEWSANGVDTVRIFAHWSRIAPAQKPSGFDSVRHFCSTVTDSMRHTQSAYVAADLSIRSTIFASSDRKSVSSLLSSGGRLLK